MRPALVLVLLTGCDWLLGLSHFDQIQEPIAGHWMQVAAGDHFTCAIDDKAALYCWGYNGGGELGANRSEAELDMPVLVPGSWASVATGSSHACAIRTGTSTLWCWGSNSYGQLGIGADASVPTQVGTDTWASVATFAHHTCAIRSDGQLFCWGYDDHGEVGNNTTMTPQSTPQQVVHQGVTSWSQVGTGSNHTCALDVDGTIYCWGANWDGMLGNASGVPSAVPIAVTGMWQAVAVGDDFNCAIDVDGHVSCWGNNDQGMLGTGSTQTLKTPTPISSNELFVDITAGYSAACARTMAGAVRCWGDPAGTSFPVATATPMELPGGPPVWTSIALGYTHMCGIGAIHDLWCVGDGTAGQLANGTSAITVPTLLDMPAPVTELDTGEVSTCALANGAISCWGDNDRGVLGVGDRLRRLTPTPLAGTNPQWKHVTVGFEHGCALDAAGLAHCWGENGSGQIGDNSFLPRPAPVAVIGGNAFVDISAGGYHTCARNATSVFCWGRNAEGQLGMGNNTMRITPAPVSSGSTSMTTGLSAGYTFTCVLDMSTDLECTGQNQNGQLGINNTVDMNNLTYSALGIPPFTTMSVGYAHGCGIKLDKSLSCWGRDYEGEIGDGGNGTVPNPKQIGSAMYTSVATGKHHTCAVAVDKHVWCWGANDHGQLGTGNLVASSTPVQVTGLDNAVTVHTGDDHTCAVDTNGAVYCWGSNGLGQVGTAAGWTTTFAQVASP